MPMYPEGDCPPTVRRNHEPEELETVMTAETFENVVKAPMNMTEHSCATLADLVTSNVHRRLILKKIVHDYIVNGSAGELEDTINEAVSNNRAVHELTTTYLDISLRDS